MVSPPHKGRLGPALRYENLTVKSAEARPSGRRGGEDCLQLLNPRPTEDAHSRLVLKEKPRQQPIPAPRPAPAPRLRRPRAARLGAAAPGCGGAGDGAARRASHPRLRRSLADPPSALTWAARGRGARPQDPQPGKGRVGEPRPHRSGRARDETQVPVRPAAPGSLPDRPCPAPGARDAGPTAVSAGQPQAPGALTGPGSRPASANFPASGRRRGLSQRARAAGPGLRWARAVPWPTPSVLPLLPRRARDAALRFSPAGK